MLTPRLGRTLEHSTRRYGAMLDLGGAALLVISIVTAMAVRTNSAGAGPASASASALIPSAASNPSSSVTVTAVPGVVPSVSAIEGNAQATSTWSAAAPNGSTITSYTVLASPGGGKCSWISGPLTCTVAGLTNGARYSFTVVGISRAGVGPVSSPSAVVIPAVPALLITVPQAATSSPRAASTMVTGTGLLPGSSVVVTVRPTPFTLATVPAGTSGTFSAVIALPTNLAKGAHMVTATGTAFDGSVVAAAVPFTVPAITAPSTGASPMIGIATLLILGGVALSGTSWRRRADE